MVFRAQIIICALCFLMIPLIPAAGFALLVQIDRQPGTDFVLPIVALVAIIGGWFSFWWIMAIALPAWKSVGPEFPRKRGKSRMIRGATHAWHQFWARHHYLGMLRHTGIGKVDHLAQAHEMLMLASHQLNLASVDKSLTSRLIDIEVSVWAQCKERGVK